MAKLSISERDRPTYNPNAQSLFQRLRSHWLSVAAIAWFLLSLHPVYHYLTSSTVRHTPRTAAVTVTETLAVPAIQATAIANSLGNTKFNHARIPDAIDTFRHFRQAQNCTMSSLDLHGPFEPLCKDRRSLMDAMTGGGRIGFDAPFSPRDCDMRWFSTEEICEIMGRFEKVFILGDSIMRNVAVAFHILLRADLVDGGRTTWADNPWEVVDCRCAGPFETSKCAFFSAVSTRVVRRHDPESLVCKDDMGGIEYRAMLEYPIKEEDMEAFQEYLEQKKPEKPYAFIMGHGLWNDLEKEKTFAWIDQLNEGIKRRAPYFRAKKADQFPRLFVGPNAAGIRKPDVFIARQGNLAITKFEHAVKPFAEDRGFDFLGTYNATIQSTNPDGTHGGMRNNLIKAMMIMNWLNSIDVGQHHGKPIPP